MSDAPAPAARTVAFGHHRERFGRGRKVYTVRFEEGRSKSKNHQPLPLNTAIRRIRRLAVESDVTHIGEKVSVDFRLWPVPDYPRSSLTLVGESDSKVGEFRLHLPRSFITKTGRKAAVESVGKVVAEIGPPAPRTEVYIPRSDAPHTGIPHLVFDVEDTRPIQDRLIPAEAVVSFLADLERESP